jgi:membrane protease subunit HflK
MPWNNQNNGGGGGGWKSGGGGGGGPWGQGPWGQGPGGGQTPDLEDILKRGQDRLKQVMPGSGLPGPLFLALAALAIAVLSFYSFTYIVKPDEQAVVLQFGKYVRWSPPGLHLRWPYPIEEVLLPKVTRQNSIEMGFRSVGARGTLGQSVRDVPEESLMLTGDENIVDVDFVVFWRINTGEDKVRGQTGTQQYLFNIQNPNTTVKEVAESSMREVVGQSDIAPLLTEARQKTETAVQKLMQRTLDGYAAGIEITQVQMQKVDPPNKVIDAFRDVQAARADQERLQNEARAYANRIVPEARGEAERILQGAEGYKQQTVAEARGQTARFLNIYQEYKKAPEVTRRRIFLETMEAVLGGTDKIILDNKGGQGVVPYLPLGELKSQGATQPQRGGQ